MVQAVFPCFLPTELTIKVIMPMMLAITSVTIASQYAGKKLVGTLNSLKLVI